MIRYIILILAILFTNSILAQTNNTYILKASRYLDISSMQKALNIDNEYNLQIIFEELNLYTIDISESKTNNIERIKSNPFVEFLIKDQQIEYRNTPNDPKYNQQYGLEQINAPSVWDINTGGLTGIGDTIVIAVLDKGCEISHNDLIDNIWRNNDEIPNDGIDNDNNGYVDDYFGVDMWNKNDIHNIHYHGTSVSGIIGAKGNNSLGIAGVNWNVKILPITNINSVSEVIKGYNYAYKLRKKYNDTNGKNGALIVCTNLSAGVPNSFPDDSQDYRDWCNIYDLLGSIGVLSVTAVTNDAVDVEKEGDMPTLCQSEYLITVTSTDINDKFDKARGFGVTSVDIAAPGKSVYTTTLNNGYRKDFTGNSAAAPFVAGAIGLLYTIPCLGFTDKLKANPEELSLKIKDYILKFSNKHTDLIGKAVSEGRLDIYETYINLSDLCENLTTGELGITSLHPNPSNSIVNIKYDTDNFDLHTIVIYNSIGQTVYSKVFRPNIFGEKNLTIDVSHYGKGIYYVSLMSGEKIITKSFMVY